MDLERLQSVSHSLYLLISPLDAAELQLYGHHLGCLTILDIVLPSQKSGHALSSPGRYGIVEMCVVPGDANVSSDFSSRRHLVSRSVLLFIDEEHRRLPRPAPRSGCEENIVSLAQPRCVSYFRGLSQGICRPAASFPSSNSKPLSCDTQDHSSATP